MISCISIPSPCDRQLKKLQMPHSSTAHLAVRTVSASPDMNAPALFPKNKLRNISYKEGTPYETDGWDPTLEAQPA
jgi:hypothetical protein